MIQPHFDLQIGLWCKFSLELYDNFFIIIPRKISIIGHFLFNFITWLHKSYPWDHVPWKKSSSFKYFFLHFFIFCSIFVFRLGIFIPLDSHSAALPQVGIIILGFFCWKYWRLCSIIFWYFTIQSHTSWFASRHGPLHYEFRPYKLLRRCPRV